MALGKQMREALLIVASGSESSRAHGAKRLCRAARLLGEQFGRCANARSAFAEVCPSASPMPKFLILN